jgi:hypothetical protein
MKLLRLSTILMMVLAASPSAQSETHSQEKSITDIEVTDFQIEGKNINQLLAKIAYKYDVPINLEVATDEDLLKSNVLTVQFKKGTLADVLNDIVKQKPSYTWETSDSVIRVFPHDEFRDPLLQTVLQTRINHMVVRKSTAKLNFREALTRSPELKDLLTSYGVRASNEAFSRFDIEPFGGDFAIELEHVPVRSILDEIKNSKTKYWFINRGGKNREYLLINF